MLSNKKFPKHQTIAAYGIFSLGDGLKHLQMFGRITHLQFVIKHPLREFEAAKVVHALLIYKHGFCCLFVFLIFGSQYLSMKPLYRGQAGARY